jgi:hypothetical protein
MMQQRAFGSLTQVRQLALLVALIACSQVVPNAAIAQVDPDEPNDPVILGVRIDGEGLLSVRISSDDPKLLYARRSALIKARAQVRRNKGKAQLGYVSLPKVFAEAKELIAAGKKLPNRVRFLGGMTKLRYVFVFPEEKDLIIAGDVEPYDAVNGARPAGLITGRPLLQLDDLVVALRTVGPGNGNNAFGCSIDPPPGAMQKISDIIKDRANRRLAKSKKADLMVDTLGPQSVRFFGIASNTRAAYVCVEADYLLKRMAMGIDPPPLAAVRRPTQRDRLQFNGLWFTPNYQPLLVSEDGNAYEIRGQSLKLHARGSEKGNAPATTGTAAYAKLFTKYFPQIAKKSPAFADLWNITDLALLASLIGQDRLQQKANWDMNWILNVDGYPVAKTLVPRTADTMAKYRTGVYIVGGVGISFGKQADAIARQKDTSGQLDNTRLRPEDKDWLLVKPQQPSRD